jgi:small GTP-binding protein
MGIIFSTVCERFLTNTIERNRVVERVVLVIGFNNSGKTLLLNRLKGYASTTTEPTIGFNLERFKYKNVEFYVWDVGGQMVLRKLWSRYINITNIVLFVLDATDTARIQLANDELFQLLAMSTHSGLKRIIVVINKIDVEGAMDIETVKTNFPIPLSFIDKVVFVSSSALKITNMVLLKEEMYNAF